MFRVPINIIREQKAKAIEEDKLAKASNQTRWSLLTEVNMLIVYRRWYKFRENGVLTGELRDNRPRLYVPGDYINDDRILHFTGDVRISLSFKDAGVYTNCRYWTDGLYVYTVRSGFVEDTTIVCFPYGWPDSQDMWNHLKLDRLELCDERLRMHDGID